MAKSVKKVFLIIGILLVCLLVWSLIFNGGLQGTWNAVVKPVNTGWGKVTGDSTSKLLPEWDADANDVSEGQDLIN